MKDEDADSPAAGQPGRGAYGDMLRFMVEGVDPNQIEKSELDLTFLVASGAHDFKEGETRQDGTRVISVKQRADGEDEVRIVIPGQARGQG
jgi:hypothetical protein